MSVMWGDDAPPTSPERCAEWVDEALFTEPQMRFHVDLGKPGGDGSGGGIGGLKKAAAVLGLVIGAWMAVVLIVVLMSVAYRAVAR